MNYSYTWVLILNRTLSRATGLFLGGLAIWVGVSTSWSQCAPDVTPPTITCPGNVSVNNDADFCGAIVNYSVPVVFDNCLGAVTQTYSFTGGVQTFTVPSGVTSITLEAWGAQGSGGNGGLGGYVKGDMAVTTGQVLNIYVGGQAGYNGGGLGHATLLRHGGGASDIRVGGTALTDRVIVAGGGGGGGPTDVGIQTGGAGGGGMLGANYAGGGGAMGYGGNGIAGALTGGSGNTSCHSGGAGGGGFTSGGGASCNTCYSSSCGQNGTLGVGGNGDTWENGMCYTDYGGTNGGGGGYYGGGGSSVGNCGGGGGGGGSSYSGTLTTTLFDGGVRLGDGQIVISYNVPNVTLTQLSGQPSASTFAVGTTTQVYQAEDGAGNIATCAFDVIVIDSEGPAADNPSLSDFNACFSANPTPPTATDNCSGALTGVPDVTLPITNPGLTIVTWSYDDGNGNTSTQSQNVIVETIDVTVNASVMTLSAVNTTATAYQWIDCGNGDAIIPGETNATFVAAADGSYAVIITEGLCIDTSSCVDINTAGLTKLVNNGAKLYPSPTSGQYTIELNQVYDQVYVNILDAAGRVVQYYTVSGASKINAEFTGNKGIYVVQILADGQLINRSLVIE
jgi:hypothetical protein